jgi:hypothetical protein
MADQVLGGAGNYLLDDRNRYAAAKKTVEALPVYGDDTDGLVEAVSKSFSLIDEGGEPEDDSPLALEVGQYSGWVHERFVRRHFADIADSFTDRSWRARSSRRLRTLFRP